MTKIPYGGPNEIPPAEVRCPNDEFENMIRKYGVVNACEWFGHSFDSEFTKETVEILLERSGIEYSYH
jgi:hypothetical protein